MRVRAHLAVGALADLLELLVLLRQIAHDAFALLPPSPRSRAPRSPRYAPMRLEDGSA